MASVTISFDEFQNLMVDKQDKANAIALLNTEFPDDTCQLIALKAIFDIKEQKNNNEDTTTEGGNDNITIPEP